MVRRVAVTLLALVLMTSPCLPVRALAASEPRTVTGVAARATPVQVVNPEQVYTYEQMTADLMALAAAYPGLVTVRSIGKSAYGRDVWAARLGRGPATVLINASHHAREWLTTNLVMYMLDRYAAEASEGRAVSELLGRVSIWFVPMVNPDGVTLHQQGLEAFPPEVREGILAINGGSSDFSGWKANAEGVDLNLQYPAEWESLRWNGTVPAFAHYKGAAPLTAPETRAMTAFTYAVDPEITVSYHATGRILYWHFHNRPEHLERDRRLAEQFGALTGYVLVQPEANPSGGGYKDWFVQTFGRPGFTPEIAAYGDGSPPGPAQFAEEWERNRLVGLFVAQEGWVLFAARNRVNLTVAGTPLLPGVLVGRHSFVSLPEALRALGISFAWDEAAGRLVAREGENSLILTAGAAEAVRNGELVALPSPPMVVQGQLWAPVRLMADTFGVRLDWEDATRTVALTR